MEDEKKVIVVEVPAPLSSEMDDSNKKKKKKLPWLSMKDVFKWAPFQLPVTSQGIKKKQKQNKWMLLSVQEVLGWALLAAGCVAVSVGITAVIVFANIEIPCSETSWIFRCPDLTPAQEVEMESFGEGFLWLTVPQAAAATVGLLLPRRQAARGRWSLAMFALASATVAHYMHARFILVIIAANPGGIGFDIVAAVGTVGFLGGDLLSLISLLVMGAEDQ